MIDIALHVFGVKASSLIQNPRPRTSSEYSQSKSILFVYELWTYKWRNYMDEEIRVIGKMILGLATLLNEERE